MILIQIALFFSIAVGIVVIILFMFIAPFNDWSWEANSTLFSQYGDFIGGFVGTIFSFAGFLLLYKTLITQQEALNIQKNDSLIQKNAIDNERFETTSFNLLNTQQNIADNIEATFYEETLNGKRSLSIKGRKIFIHAIKELKKINGSIFGSKYNEYNEDIVEYLKIQAHEAFNPQNREEYMLPSEAQENKRENNELIKELYANKFYNITKERWKKISKKAPLKKTKIMYYLFWIKFDYAIEHYFNHIYYMLKHIERYEKTKLDDTSYAKAPTTITEDCCQYAQIIQAQMSSSELALLYYHTLCFPGLQRLAVKYDLFVNLPKEHLISKDHYDENSIKLKSRKELLEI